MLWTIFMILLILWLLGWAGFQAIWQLSYGLRVDDLLNHGLKIAPFAEAIRPAATRHEYRDICGRTCEGKSLQFTHLF